jgi:protein EFR3
VAYILKVYELKFFRASEMKTQPNSPYLTDFRDRPAMERRARSIHLHVTGETGPSPKDVANAAMRALAAWFEHSNGAQVAIALQATIESLNEISAWDKTDHCRWFAVRAAEWTQYQYRYAVPTRLVEYLVQDQDAPQSTQRHSTIAAMITAVFTSPIPLVNLSTSDIISSLISVILRRVAKDPDDVLLPALVESIASLGTHVYYADQIQDLAGELISRLIVVETSGVFVNGKADLGRVRSQAVRCLLAGLLSLIHAAEMHDTAKEEGDNGKTVHKVAPAESSLVVRVEGDATRPPRLDGHTRPSRRTNVSPEVWQDTLSLLCDGDYAVRADYAATLVSYLEREIPKLWDSTDVDGVKRIRPLAEGPTQKAVVSFSVLFGDNTTRFLNALHAQCYMLATSTRLGISTQAYTPSSQRSVNGDTTTTEDSNQQPEQDATEDRAPSRRSIAIPRTRKTSIMQRLLRNIPSKLSSMANVSATLSDYGNMLMVLTAVHKNLPVRGLLTGVPMLLALDGALQSDSSAEAESLQRIHAIREVLARTWIVIGKVWSCPAIVEIAQKVCTVHLLGTIRHLIRAYC